MCSSDLVQMLLDAGADINSEVSVHGPSQRQFHFCLCLSFLCSSVVGLSIQVVKPVLCFAVLCCAVLCDMLCCTILCCAVL